jgi:hypothetical protein
MIEVGLSGLVELLDVDGLAVGPRDMTAVLWGKLLLNLNNALAVLPGCRWRQNLPTGAGGCSSLARSMRRWR